MKSQKQAKTKRLLKEESQDALGKNNRIFQNENMNS